MTKEETLQVAVADYLRLQYPKALFTHIANERQTTPQRGAKFKRMGVKKGMPDILVFEPTAEKDQFGHIIGIKSHGLAIELKIKPNRPTDEQKNILLKLKARGWETAICYSFDEARNTIDNYFT